MKPFSEKMASQLLRWYLNQPEIERKECHVEQRKRINVVMNDARKQGLKGEAGGELYYLALLFGIQKRSRLQANKKLRSKDDLEAVTEQRIAVEKARGNARPSPKRDRLMGDLRPVVEKLILEKLSWQKISDYLAKYHKIRCSRGYIEYVFSNL